MIYKSYQIENKIEALKQNITLFYGENIGLINDFRIKIKKHYKDSTVLNFTQDEIIKNENLFYNEVYNTSLFGEKKIIFIIETSEKIFKFVENISIKNK